MQAVREYLTKSYDDGFAQLLEILRIPSVSTTPAHAQDVLDCAYWIVDRMRSIGVPEVRLVETPRHPIVVGKWHAAPGKPTILVYGHYDVQPVDPLGEWLSPPFEPTERDGRVYARGAGDMKGNLVALLQAVEALARTSATGAPPVNLTFLWEGEEEIGSPSAPTVVAELRDELAADVVMSCDGGMADPATAALWVSFKGMAALELEFRTGSTDMHSGEMGAWVPNAAQVMLHVGGNLHEDSGRVAVPGFYDHITELSEAERDEIYESSLSDEVLFEETGVSATWGEPGYTPEERRSSRPTIDINGYWSGFQGDGTKTVTPCLAHLKITCRLAPGQDPNLISQLIADYAQSIVPVGVTVTAKFTARNGRGYSIPRDNKFLLRLTEVLEDEYDRPVRVIRVGGSVPITAMFKDVLGLETISLGFLMPNANLHAPNEWLRIEDFERARRVYSQFLTSWS